MLWSLVQLPHYITDMSTDSQYAAKSKRSHPTTTMVRRLIFRTLKCSPCVGSKLSIYVLILLSKSSAFSLTGKNEHPTSLFPLSRGTAMQGCMLVCTNLGVVARSTWKLTSMSICGLYCDKWVL